VAEHSEHIVSPKLYFVILMALLVGTVLTVQAAKIDLGRGNIVLALTIAVTKMTLVILFFMHGKYSSRRTKLIIASGFFWLAIMLVLTLADYTTRHPEPSRSQFAPVPMLVAPAARSVAA
jgi:cytochrome c oxidase subunit IV